jgi:3-oxoadipate enol-lactonase
VEPVSTRVPAAHGLTLHALEWSREGVPLLFLHGFGNEAHVWDEIAPAFAPYYRTLALDLRGHGDSDRDLEARYDYPDHVADLEEATRALGIERLVLVGHSLGGRVSMLFAGRHPERMAGLVIVDSAPDLDARGTVRIRLDIERSGEESSFPSPESYQEVLARNYPAASPEALARLARFGLRRREDGRLVPKLDPAHFRARAEASAEDLRAREERLHEELWDALRRVACPTLVIRGAASDVVDPDVAERMAEEVLSHGRLALVERAGHSVMVDNPTGCRDAIAAFVLGEE